MSSHFQSDYNTEHAASVRYAWVAMIWGILLGRSIVSIARPDGPSVEIGATRMEIQPEVAPSGVSLIIMYGAHAAVLAIAAVSILIATRCSRPLNAGILLWCGALIFAVGPVISGIYGVDPALSPDTVRMPLFFTAVFLLQPVSLSWFVRRCKSAIEAYTFATLAFGVIAPSQVFPYYESSLIPELPIRLQAIGGGHSNSFAPLLATYLVLGWIAPARSYTQRAVLVIIVGCLLLTQSKTVLIAVALMYAVRFFYVSGVKRYIAAYATALVSVVSLLVLTVTNPKWTAELASFLFADEFTTLTGRTDLWRHSLDLWREKPTLGYGPEAWQLEMTTNYALRYYWFPGTAHNQVLQTLGETGIVGLFGLAFFVTILIVQSVQFSRYTQGASLALLVLTVLRGVTETPLMRGLHESFFILFVIYSMLILSAVATTKGSAKSEATATGEKANVTPMKIKRIQRHQLTASKFPHERAST